VGTNIIRSVISGCRSNGRGKKGASDEYRGKSNSYTMKRISDTPEPTKEPMIMELDQP
jgi:hypothetical protein